MNIKAIIGLLVVVALAAGAWWLLANPPEPAMEETQTVQASEFKEESEYSTVAVQYPSASGKVRAAIEAEMGSLVADFKQNVEGVDETVLPSLAGRKLAFAAEYKEYTSADTRSYLYTVYEDTGGAHPNGYFVTFVFDAEGNRVELGDVLSANPNWLEELSLVVSNEVSAQYRSRTGADDLTGLLYPEGLAPKAENFQNWVLDGETLVVMIPPYQVAAYAAGSFEVRIPLADINQ